MVNYVEMQDIVVMLGTEGSRTFFFFLGGAIMANKISRAHKVVWKVLPPVRSRD